MRHVKIFFQVLEDEETGQNRFKVFDNGGELEASYFDLHEEAAKDIEDREDHYLRAAVRVADLVTVESVGVNVH